MILCSLVLSVGTGLAMQAPKSGSQGSTMAQAPAPKKNEQNEQLDKLNQVDQNEKEHIYAGLALLTAGYATYRMFSYVPKIYARLGRNDLLTNEKALSISLIVGGALGVLNYCSPKVGLLFSAFVGVVDDMASDNSYIFRFLQSRFGNKVVEEVAEKAVVVAETVADAATTVTTQAS